MRTFSPRSAIAGVGIVAGETETHRHDGHGGLVVEGLAVEPDPVAQPIAARVVERKARVVHADPRRLADDRKTGRYTRPKHRAHALRQMRLADPAGTDLRQEKGKRIDPVQHPWCRFS